MNLTDLHRRLLADVLAVGGAYPLALAGVKQFRHTAWSTGSARTSTWRPRTPIAWRTLLLPRAGPEQHGWQGSALETDPLSARLIVTDPVSHEKCGVDILKEALRRPSVHTDHGPGGPVGPAP
nr:hypothetical protein [Streptomyces globisporus]